MTKVTDLNLIEKRTLLAVTKSNCFLIQYIARNIGGDLAQLQYEFWQRGAEAVSHLSDNEVNSQIARLYAAEVPQEIKTSSR